MSEPRRWTLHGLTSRPYLEGRIAVPERIDPPLDVDEVVEVMPVSEHERWRDAFLEGQKADHAKHLALREAAQDVVDADFLPARQTAVERLRAVLNSGQEQRDD